MESGDESDDRGCDVDPEHDLGDGQATLDTEVVNKFAALVDLSLTNVLTTSGPLTLTRFFSTNLSYAAHHSWSLLNGPYLPATHRQSE